ncbi:hypothetical protein HRM2_42480 [Desulforapulum autotrophicum HRM2]|uniref:Glycosyltransferase 2-like domain-containing protein n=1 Tax=Desulforapulum autotrophicum (strain ATCC 43914 / DSM 3382 / VKM B-1955 / HRM2) TaxID=177437 RepID=C0QD72_DESAH|nr:hypothetical protein [Desulforapulum autotrophicum]ACN17304.1 hypothetical protein HRM2_42480 [Desulforapulum autotrophicum HRM2]
MWWHIKNRIHTMLTSVPVSSKPGLKVIVSLTTIPSRISSIRKTIDSLLDQTRPPDEITINLPKMSKREKCGYRIPSFLQNYADEQQVRYPGLPQKPILTINRTEKDWGPATKFIPVLQREKATGKSDTLCIIVDDDRSYVNTMVSNFIRYHAEYPDKVLCNRGRNLDGQYEYCKSTVIAGPKINTPQDVDIITGVGGYALPLNIMDENLWDYSTAPESAFYMDDIWISGWLAQNHINRIAVPTHTNLYFGGKKRKNRISSLYKRNKKLDDSLTLDDIPGPDNPREFHNNTLIEYFREYWQIKRDVSSSAGLARAIALDTTGPHLPVHWQSAG